jgi:WD40 repeat protein
MTTRTDIRRGTVVGTYRIEGLLGRGGMSSVYVARDLALERDVALKVVAPELAEDERLIRRFRQESRVAAALEHPAVVPVYDAGEAGDVFYIAMRLVRGGDLRALLADRGPLDTSEAVTLLAPIADALDAAHGLGLVHRDVKPGNVLVGEDGRSYLTDFGLTKNTSAGTTPSIVGELIGTIEYISPEQIRGDDLDGRADQYSLACVLFECVTGRSPFARESELSTLWAHVEEVAPLPTALRAELPSSLDDAVAIALRKDPGARFASCSEFLERAGAATPQAQRARSPFIGLAAFDVADAPYFFGRERLVAELAAVVRTSSFLAIVGPSGSGKSSVLRAGLLPALAHGAAAMDPVLLRPGVQPADALELALNAPLASALDELSAGRRLLIAVDQFEELFTAGSDDDDRAAFVNALVEAASDPSGRAVVVVAMRADYFGDCAAYPALVALLGGRTVLVGTMSRDELARTIEGPAARSGLAVERGLTDAILDDLGGAPGGLPLLSTALQELWVAREGQELTRSAYERSGGVRGAIARMADGAYAGLPPTQRSAARRIFVRLADTGTSGEPVRRRVPLAELDVETDADARMALAAVTSGRLVTADEESVEVAHEALFREWPRLRAWLEEDADDRVVRRALTDAAIAWQASGRDAGDLYRGARLASALEWQGAHGSELNELERAFLDASRAAAEREAFRDRRTNRRLRLLLALAAALMLIAAAAFVVALSQRSSAREAAVRSEVQRLATLSRTQKELDRSILLAREAVELSDSPEARGALLASLLRAPGAARIYRPGLGRPAGLAASPTGSRLLVWNDKHVGALLDTRSGRVLARASVVRGRFTADGRTAILMSSRGVTYVDAQTGKTLRAWRWPKQKVRHRDVSPDGRTALAVEGDGRELVVLDTRSSSVRLRIEPPTGQRFLRAAFAPDGQHVVTVARAPRGDGLLRYGVWAPGEDNPLADVAGSDAAFVPAVDREHRRLAARSEETGAITFVDLFTGARRRSIQQHQRAVAGLAFSPDGRFVASAGDDGVVMLWEANTGERVDVFATHTGRVRAPVFGDDGRTLYTAGTEGAVIAWDVAGSRPLGRPFLAGAGGRKPALSVSPDGRLVAATDRHGIAVIDEHTLARVATLSLGARENPVAIEFSPDGTRLAAAGSQGRVVVWRTSNWQRAPDLRLPGSREREAVIALAFSPDGAVLAGATSTRRANSRGRVVTWEVETGRSDARELSGALTALAFSPDGDLVAVALNDPGGRRGFGGFVAALDLNTLSERYHVDVDSGYGRASAVAFSPDGGLLATAGGTGDLRFFDAETGEPRGRAALAETGWLLSLDFSPDGEMLVATGADGSPRLVDVEGRAQLGPALPVRQEGPGAAAFAPDGASLFAIDSAGRGVRWDVNLSRLEAHACRVAGRVLTQSEWDRFLPSRPYDPACR